MTFKICFTLCCESNSSHAGACARMDFILKRQRIVIEAKKTREHFADKEIGEELLVDIAKSKNTRIAEHWFASFTTPRRA